MALFASTTLLLAVLAVLGQNSAGELIKPRPDFRFGVSGNEVVVTGEGKVAYTGGYGIVFSEEPMLTGFRYEVKINKVRGDQVYLGVTKQIPPSLDTLFMLINDSVIVSSDRIIHTNQNAWGKPSEVGEDLAELEVGDTVGLELRRDGSLNLYINGKNQGKVKINKVRGDQVYLGVTKQIPPYLDTLFMLINDSVIVTTDRIIHTNQNAWGKPSEVGEDLAELEVGDTVGLELRRDGSLNLYINGKNQGKVSGRMGVPEPCYFAFLLFHPYPEDPRDSGVFRITALPVKRQAQSGSGESRESLEIMN